MKPAETLALAKDLKRPAAERAALFRQVAEDPKAKAGERVEALIRGLELEARSHVGPLPPELLQRAHEAIDALSARGKDKLWPLMHTFLDRLQEEDQEEEAVALFFAWIPLERSKGLRPKRAGRLLARFFLHPRVQELAYPRTPRWMRGQPLLGTTLPVRRIGSPYGIRKQANSAKLGGLPGLADPADWPRDPQGRPMQHLAQLASVHVRGPGWPVPPSGLYQFFASQQAIEDLGGPCAVRFQPSLREYAPVDHIQDELLEAFGALAVRHPSCYHDHEDVQAMGPYDHRFDALVAATDKQKAEWDALSSQHGELNQIGGHARFRPGGDPRAGQAGLDMLLLQLSSDPRYGMSWGGGEGRVWFFGDSEAVRRGDLSGVRFLGDAG